MSQRFHQTILIISTLGFCWLTMQAVHELGHVLGALLTGGSVVRVVLHPLAFSRTEVHPNPHPQFVVWAGPVIGALLPVLAWSIARFFKSPGLFLFRFFAGFCLIANGVYIGAGSLYKEADAGDMIRHGSPTWLLIAFGVATVPAGFLLWHKLGPSFGMGDTQPATLRKPALIMTGLFVAIMITEWLVS